jgi:hypothetical protein
MKISALFADRALARLVVLLAVDVLFFSLVNPKKTASFVVVLGFLLLLLTMYALLRICIGKIGRQLGAGQGSIKKSVLLLTIFSGVLIGMQSIGQLSLRDFLAITPLIIILYFYLSYFRKS